MTLYTFEHTKTKERRTFDFDFGKAPGVGACIQADGAVWRRVFDSPVMAVQPDVHFKAWSQDPYTPGIERFAAGFDPVDGTPLFDSRKKAEEFAAENGGTYGER